MSNIMTNFQFQKSEDCFELSKKQSDVRKSFSSQLEDIRQSVVIQQLLSDKISIFNIFSKKEIDIAYFLETYNLKPEEYLFSRILEGDKSDNILGVEGIGPKRAQQLAKEYKTLDNLINSLPLKGKAKYINNLNASKEKLLTNERLISLKKYNQKVIDCAKDGKEVWDVLCEIVSH
jgi:5'-3' exonuclease